MSSNALTIIFSEIALISTLAAILNHNRRPIFGDRSRINLKVGLGPMHPGPEPKYP